MLKHRVLTACLLIPVVVFTVLASNANYFGALMAVIVMLAAREWGRLLKVGKAGFSIYAVFTVVLLTGVYLSAFTDIYLLLAIISATFWCVAIALIVAYQRNIKLLPKSRWFMLLLGQILLISTWSSLYYIKAFLAEGTILLLLFMLIIWSADSGAYFVGRSIGKRRLASNVSPGKTWEGTVGGFITAMLMGYLFYLLVPFQKFELMLVLLVIIFTVMFSVVGDLFESILKRDANIKDSGRLLPGHGGALDRIDSLMAASPFYALAYTLLGNAG